MKLSEKHKWGMLLILLIGVIIFYIVFLPEIKKAKYFNDTVEMLHKNYKIKINKGDYIVEYKPSESWVSGYYYIKKKNENLKSTKSKYLKLNPEVYYGSSYTNIIYKEKYNFTRPPARHRSSTRPCTS